MERIDCVGGLVRDAAGRILLIRRGREPDKGCWSLPGGKVEPGESDVEATAREVLEETGLVVEVGAFLGAVEIPVPGGVYDVRDYLCSPAHGTDPDAVRAGDDAEDAAWFAPADVPVADCSPMLPPSLRAWGVL